MKKKASAFLLTAALTVFSAMGAFAAVESIEDLYAKADSLGKMADYDIAGLIGSGELVGDRKRDFSMAVAQYKNTLRQAQANMLRIADAASAIQKYEQSEENKHTKILEKFQDADNVIYGINSASLGHLNAAEANMPSVSYQKYSKRFLNYYNSLNLSDVNIEI